jgi:hypothetical protein
MKATSPSSQTSTWGWADPPRKSEGVFSKDRPPDHSAPPQRLETAHFTISYGPVPDETSITGVGGVLVTAVETSDRKRAEDALRHLNQTLGTHVAERAREHDEIWQACRHAFGD